jgi:transposase-like protein
MLEKPRRPVEVIDPLWEALTFDKLPPAETARWTPRRKAEVVAAVSGGLLSADEACQRYSLSVEEFTSWRRAVHLSGTAGLS